MYAEIYLAHVINSIIISCCLRASQDLCPNEHVNQINEIVTNPIKAYKQCDPSHKRSKSQTPLKLRYAYDQFIVAIIKSPCENLFDQPRRPPHNNYLALSLSLSQVCLFILTSTLRYSWQRRWRLCLGRTAVCCF